MKIVYSPRSQGEFDKIAAYYTTVAGIAIAEKIEKRLREVIEHIRRSPLSAPRIRQRSRVRIAAVVDYPFRIYYQAHSEHIYILYIRHTSRRPISGA